MEYQLITPSIPIQTNSLVEWVFANRGMTPAQKNHYLNTSREDILDPLLLDNMREGAKMLVKHLSAGDKIFVQVDADADGMTSSAALINYINMFAPGVAQNNILYRVHTGKQHGIILNTIPDDVKLVIIPDAGSNQISEHKELWDKGIDVLVLDHHEVDEISLYACIINNQTCDYPNKTLSGVGVVYKFCSYLDSLLGCDYADRILDLVAVGIVADMMDLRNFETKELIDLGLNNLRNPFITAFADA